MSNKTEITTDDLGLLLETETNNGEGTLWNDFDNAAQALVIINMTGKADETIKEEKRDSIEELQSLHSEMSEVMNKIYLVDDSVEPSISTEEVIGSFNKLVDVLNPDNENAKKYIEDINAAFEKIGIDINERSEGHFANMVKNRTDISR